MNRPWPGSVAWIAVVAGSLLLAIMAAPAVRANVRAIRTTHALMRCGFSLLDFRGEPCRGVAPGAAGGLSRLALLAAGETEAARVEALRALQEDPRDWRARMVLAHALEQSGQPKEAMAEWRRIAARPAFYALANSHRTAGRCGLALQYLELADAMGPVEPASALWRGQCEKALGRTADAERSLRRAVATIPFGIAPRTELAELLLGRPDAGSRAEARRLFEEALTFDPRTYPAYQPLIELYASAGDWTSAARVARRMVEQFPNHHLAPMLLAQVQQGSGHPDEAERWFLRSIEIDGQYAPSHYFLGLLHFSRRGESASRLDQAIAELSEAVRLTNLTPHPNAAMAAALCDALRAKLGSGGCPR